MFAIQRPVRINTTATVADTSMATKGARMPSPLSEIDCTWHMYLVLVSSTPDPYHLIELGSQEVYMGMHNVWPNDSGICSSDPKNCRWPHDIGTYRTHKTFNKCTLCPMAMKPIHNAYFRGDTIFAAWYVDGA